MENSAPKNLWSLLFRFLFVPFGLIGLVLLAWKLTAGASAIWGPVGVIHGTLFIYYWYLLTPRAIRQDFPLFNWAMILNPALFSLLFGIGMWSEDRSEVISGLARIGATVCLFLGNGLLIGSALKSWGQAKRT